MSVAEASGNGQIVTDNVMKISMSRVWRVVAVVLFAGALSACSGFNLFGPSKIVEEEIIPPEVLYQTALDDMDRQYFSAALAGLAKLERQHPYSQYSEKAKLMTTFAHFRTGQYEETVLAADRYLALYPSSPEVPYILYLKGNSYFAQIKDITRDQQLAQDSLDTFRLLVSTYPDSEYVEESRENMRKATDQLAGKEMSVGRYYLGNGQYTAAINRFRRVVEGYQTSSHIEEALFRLTEAYLKLGLVGEAQSAAAVLGLNYPSSDWYEEAYALLQQQGLAPQSVEGNWLTASSQLT